MTELTPRRGVIVFVTSETKRLSIGNLTSLLSIVIQIDSDVSSNEEDNASEEGKTMDTSGEDGETTDTAGEEGETTDTAGEEGK